MHVLQVSAEVPTLRESLVAVLASKRPLASMLAEVVPQVTRLFED